MSRFQRLTELFDRGVDLPVSEQERLLRERCDGDPALASELRAMLTAARRPLAEFERGAGDLLERLQQDDDPEALCGTVIGDGERGYEIEAHVATGGMAHVYRAVRIVAGTRRRVALKVLREGLDSAAFLRRFERERATLARLDHELIVTFLDVGALPDGRPFLAMEFVDGMTALDWAEARSVAERVALGARVADALQYAHTQLVVHRDLKPSNVLVLGDGAPRLLDFGIATMLDDGAGDGSAPMTPAYASPEQLTGAPVTAASDVFALGRLLQELLTGDPDGRVTEADLRAIVERATAARPADRYPSASAMGADLRRFLAHEPVRAGPVDALRRSRLFARRHSWSLAFAAAVVLALAVGWISAHLGRREAQAEASLGWGAHTQARQAAAAYERSLVALAAESVTIAVATIDRLERELAAIVERCPETEVLLRLTLAELLLAGDQPTRALDHAERAAELAGRSRGVGPREVERASGIVSRCRAAMR